VQRRRNIRSAGASEAKRKLMYVVWLIGLAGVLGVVLRPAMPWLLVWAAMLTFGGVKLPSELRDLWRGSRDRREAE